MSTYCPALKRLVIAFTGAQGVGKSTLVSAVESEIVHLELGPCSVHKGLGQEAVRSGVPLGEKADRCTILEFARLHVRRERELGEGIHLLDRCFVDLLAYTRILCSEDVFLTRLVEELTQASLARIGVIVHVPFGRSVVDTRPCREPGGFRASIDLGIAQILRELKVRPLVVGDGPVGSRAGQVLEFLRRNGMI